MLGRTELDESERSLNSPYLNQREAEAMTETPARRRLGFVDANPDCSLVQFWRMSNLVLESSTDVYPVYPDSHPVYGSSCTVMFSTHCVHCNVYHNFHAKPSSLPQFCDYHKRDHRRDPPGQLRMEFEALYVARMNELRRSQGLPELSLASER